MLTAAVDLARANGIQPELLLKSWADAQAEQAENPKKH
jgi:hypothetical protein